MLLPSYFYILPFTRFAIYEDKIKGKGLLGCLNLWQELLIDQEAPRWWWLSLRNCPVAPSAAVVVVVVVVVVYY